MKFRQLGQGRRVGSIETIFGTTFDGDETTAGERVIRDLGRRLRDQTKNLVGAPIPGKLPRLSSARKIGR